MNGMKCACGKIARYSNNLKFNGYKIDGQKCKYCNESYYNPEKAEKILLLNKLKKTKYLLKLGQIKSNLIVRIPKDISCALNLQKGAEVELKLKDKDKIILNRK